ncbi:MAG: tRNA (adenosine(37)-N6)-threonylcarbamoyltransferase complex transferase subunit TsaD [Phycisphaeraceae bacterium]
MTLILGLETSCDETAAAVVEDGRLVRSSVVASQHELHEQYQGVVPEIASRAHLEVLSPVVEQAIADAGISLNDIGAIAVGNRPGLIGSLLVGVSAAQALSWITGKPLIGIDHVQAHLYAASLHEPGSEPAPEPPTGAVQLGLVVSGGHTSLYQVDSPTELHAIGRTIDDAVGEAYDKAAVILGLGYPGGPKLDRLAQQGDPEAYDLPRSLLKPGSLDFSFSGLKTALLYTVRGRPQGRGKSARFERSEADLSDRQRADLAASFQAAAIGVLFTKLRRALKQLENQGKRPGALVIGGGVSANSLLREQSAEFGRKHDLIVRIPRLSYCMDNAAMVAGLADAYYREGRCAGLDLPAMATTACR